jgi:hypothetical protein
LNEEGGGFEERHEGGGLDVLVTSYTELSTMMYIPELASLWDATSATEKVLDILNE